MLRTTHNIQQVIKGFIFKLSSLVSVTTSDNDLKARLNQSGSFDESIGHIDLHAQSPDVQRFFLNLADHYSQELEDGRRVVTVCIVADPPRFSRGILPEALIGMEVRHRDSKEEYVVSSTITSESKAVKIQLVTYAGGREVEKRVEPFDHFLRNYEPMG